MRLTETQWARIGLSMVVGFWSACALLLILYAPRLVGYEPVLAVLGGFAIGAGLYIYDSRTDAD